MELMNKKDQIPGKIIDNYSKNRQRRLKKLKNNQAQTKSCRILAPRTLKNQ